jgi:hypothetical protein
MKPSLLIPFLLASQVSLLSADDLTVDNLTINASATVTGASTFASWATFQGGAQFDGSVHIYSNLGVTGSADFSHTAAFGTLYTGLQSSPTPTGRAFTVSTSQGFQEVQVPYTVEGYYQDGYITVEDYGTIYSGHWEAQYTWGIVSGQSYPAVYDENNVETTPAYDDYQYGYIYTGDVWVDDSYWGVIGTHSEPGQIWVEAHDSTYTDYQFDVPKIQFTAARSDANWAWQVPASGGGVKDIMLLWNGGLRIPSEDSNRMMALMEDSLTQSYQQPWDGTQERLDSSELRMNELKKYTRVRYDTGLGEVTEISTSQVRSESIQFSHEEQMAGTSSTVQTQIAAKSATFGGVVQVEGDVKVHGVLRVLPAGDLEMGSYTNGPQP